MANGLTAETVALNIGRLRKASGLTLAELSERLTETGHPISLSAISKIENVNRSVDTDDLVALAIALNVSPLALLMPAPDRSWEASAVTGATTSAERLWRWATGETPLHGQDQRGFQARSLPWWLRVELEVPDPALQAAMTPARDGDQGPADE
jgi:transcriptional regulator with XRE-family HTH domain